jgi:hypothetical protein
MRNRRACYALLLLSGFGVVKAQTLPFQLTLTEGQNATTLQNGGTVALLSTIAQTATAQVQLKYTGTGVATITSPPAVFGSTTFKATLSGTLPVVLNSGSTLLLSIQFTPTSGTVATGQINLSYVDTESGGTATNGSITLSLQGTAPSFVLSYALASNQNVVPVQNGGVIAFSPTLVGTTASATLNVTNTGSGPGMVTAISPTGSAFRLQGIPLLPNTIGAGQSLVISLIYAPTAISSDTGQVSISFDSGATVTLNLSGSGIGPTFTYQTLNTSPPTPVSAGGTISFPDTNVSQTSSVSVRIQNTGNASGTVNTIAAAGSGLSVTIQTPLPQTLPPGASLTFTINFSPTAPGTSTGTLFVNSDSFNLAGKGLGSLLTFSYVAGGQTITLGGTNNSVIFAPIAVSQSEQIALDVKNAGTLPATISNIGAGQANSPFTLSGVPALPVTLTPGSDFQITIKFAPVALGFSNGTLLLDSTSVALVGSGTQPPPLPAYTLSGPTGNATPITQPTIGLTLASAYPVAISGTLTMTVSGNLPADPAVQFATGGRSVAFVIPANQTAAVFGSLGTQLGLQTGTVASTITLTPAFTTQAGAIDITPQTPQSLQFAIAPAAPTLVAIQMTGFTATGFVAQITGYSTTRSLTSAVIQLTPVAGYTLPATKFTIDLSQASTLWFQGATSPTYGGLFTLSIPFALQMPSSNSNTPVVNPIASVSATVANSVGTSNSIQTVQ